MFEMLPLSPARAWAISRNFIRLDLLVNNLKLNITGGNQDGCNSQHLSDLNPHASSSGGSIGVERFYLVANVLCLSACSSMRGHPKTNLSRLLPGGGDALGQRTF